MDVNTDMYEAGPHPFAQEGIHYSVAAGKKAGVGYIARQWIFIAGAKALRAPV